MSHLTLIMPAYNEAESLQIFLPSVISFCIQNSFELIVINDGSQDNTPKVLEDFSQKHEVLKVLHHKLNKGYGAAIKTGIQNANTEYVITLDADGQHTLDDVIVLYNEIKKEDADMIVGNRSGVNEENFIRKIGKNTIRFIAKQLMTLNIHDINSGMKIYTTELAKKYIHLCPDTMAFSDIILLCFVFKKHLVLERPIKVNQRIAGKSTITVATAFNTVKEILNIVVLFNPMRIFFPISIIFFVLGLVWGLPFILLGRGLSVGAAPTRAGR